MNTLEMSVFIGFLFAEKMNMNNSVAVKSHLFKCFHLKTKDVDAHAHVKK